MRHLAALLAVVVVVGAGGSRTARAQAYVDEPNSATFGVSYTYAPAGKFTADSSGSWEIPVEVTFAHLINPSLAYVTPIEGLAVEAELGLLAIKAGQDNYYHWPMEGPYDDGELHFTATDLTAGLRYQIKPIEEYLGLALSAGGIIPVADYPTMGTAHAGDHLKGVYGGIDVARTLDPAIPDLFLAAGYKYVLRERVDEDEFTEDLNRNYSDASGQIGYFLPKGFVIAAGVNARFTHGGADLETMPFGPASVQYFHDRLMNEDFVLLGGDLQYNVNDQMDLGIAARFFVWGENTRNQNLYGLYASYKLF